MSGGTGRATRALAAAMLVAAGPLGAQAPEAGPLVGPDWVAERLGPGLVVLQVGPAETYAREHVPGAIDVRPRDLALPMPDDGRHADHLVLELPDPAALEATLEGMGVGDRSLIVVVPSDGWISPATRVLFTLDWAGLGDRARFLDGGLEAWKAAGHPVTATTPSPLRGELTVRSRPELVAGMEWVRSGGASGPGFALVDARAAAFYDGAREDRGLRGHIPGAGSAPWSGLVHESGNGVVTFRPLAELRAVLARAGVEPGDTVVAYCHIGQFATAVVAAARVLGHPVRLFDGSVDAWARAGHPMETVRPSGR